jgi:hypothetical protein
MLMEYTLIEKGLTDTVGDMTISGNIYQEKIGMKRINVTRGKKQIIMMKIIVVFYSHK